MGAGFGRGLGCGLGGAGGGLGAGGGAMINCAVISVLTGFARLASDGPRCSSSHQSSSKCRTITAQHIRMDRRREAEKKETGVILLV
ncbi:hypothetical protein GJA_4790 [Janthinobacterium agaricidamnosum NBRC 102515 = DSM 9628]|uniref:Uncharacterized protein n=1 Tax=Janthinobacterium agaricidamnosum NBRC 102515 = DSM 9628 TaxID=1349767 RepID=W0V989_9BURK|nr:hypothetical protein GJA_4790 [Janthinobacterium agaricidamnosum NBRC 102515 = DSM 9628]